MMWTLAPPKIMPSPTPSTLAGENTDYYDVAMTFLMALPFS